MSAAVLRHRYQRLLAAYPSDWRAANGAVVLDTLLEAAGPTRRWPSPREAVALLVGGVRARAQQAAAGDPRWRWVDGLHIGAILLTVTGLSIVVNRTATLIAYGVTEWDTPLSLTLEVVPAVLLLLMALAVVRARVLLALIAAAVTVPVSVTIALMLDAYVAPGRLTGGLTGLVAETTVGALPLIMVLGVLVKAGGARRRSWAWLLLPVALGLADTFAHALRPAGTIIGSVTLVVMVAALVLAVATGEVRPAVALAVYGMPYLLMIVDGAVRFGTDGAWIGTLRSTPGALAVALAVAAWVAVRARRGSAPGGPAPGKGA